MIYAILFWSIISGSGVHCETITLRHIGSQDKVIQELMVSTCKIDCPGTAICGDAKEWEMRILEEILNETSSPVSDTVGVQENPGVFLVERSKDGFSEYYLLKDRSASLKFLELAKNRTEVFKNGATKDWSDRLQRRLNY